MAALYCICSVCNKKFDRSIIPAVKTSTKRYAHRECAIKAGVDFTEIENQQSVNNSQTETSPSDLRILTDYIQKLLGSEADWPALMKLVQKYKQEFDFTYSGMYKTLKYFYEIKKNKIPDSKRIIAIIPYSYNDAKNYFYNLFLLEQAAKEYNDFTPVIKEITIPAPSINRKKRLFNLEGEENNE